MQRFIALFVLWVGCAVAQAADVTTDIQYRLGGRTAFDRGGVWDGTQDLASLSGNAARGETVRLTLDNSAGPTALTDLASSLGTPSGFQVLLHTATFNGVAITASAGTGVNSGRTLFALAGLSVPVAATRILAIDVVATATAPTSANANWSYSGTGLTTGTVNAALVVREAVRNQNLSPISSVVNSGATVAVGAVLRNEGTGGMFSATLDASAFGTVGDSQDLTFVGFSGAGATLSGQILTFPYVAAGANLTGTLQLRARGCAATGVQITVSDRIDTVPDQLLGEVAVLPVQPVLGWAPANLTLPSSGAWTPLSVTFTNTGVGAAESVIVTAPALATGMLQVRVASSGSATWTQGPSGTFTSAANISIAASGGTLPLPLEVLASDGCATLDQRIEWGFTYRNFCASQATGQPAITQVQLSNVPALAGGLTLLDGVDSQRLVVGSAARVQVAASWSNAFDTAARISAGTAVITLPARLQLTGFTPPTGVVVNGQVVTWTVPAPATASGAMPPLDLPITLVADSDPCASGGVALNVTQTFTATLVGSTCSVTAPTSNVRLIALSPNTVPSATNEVIVDGSPALDGRWETGADDDGNAIRERTTKGEGEFIPWKASFFFGSSAAVAWGEAVYYDDYTADLRQDLVSSVTVEVTNLLFPVQSATYTIPSNDVSSDPITGLSVSLASLQGLPAAGNLLADRSIKIRYRTTVRDPAIASVETLERQLQRVRVVYGTGGACGAVEQAVATDLAVTRARAAIQVDVPSVVDEGVPFTATLTVTAGPFSVFNPAVTPNFGPYQLVPGSEIYTGAFAGRIEVVSGTYFMTKLSGGLPTAAFPAQLNAGSSGTITISLIRPRGVTGDTLQATVDYDTAASRVVAASRIFEAAASDRPTFVRAAGLVLDASPSTVTVLSREVSWAFYASNLGSGELPGLTVRIAGPLSAGQPALILDPTSPISVSGPAGLLATDLQLNLVSGKLELTLVNPAAKLAPGQQVRVVVRGVPTNTAVWPLAPALIDGNWGARGVDDTTRQRLSVAFQEASKRVQVGVIRSGDPIGAGAVASTADMKPDAQPSAGVVYAYIRNTGQTTVYQGLFVVALNPVSNDSGLTWDTSRAIRFKLRENSVWSAWTSDATIPTASGSTLTWTGTTPEVGIGLANTVAKALSRLDPPDTGRRSAVLVEIPVKASELAADVEPTVRATGTVQAPLSAVAVSPIVGNGTVEIRKPAVSLAVDGRNNTTASGYGSVVRADTGDQIEWRIRATNTSSVVTMYNLYEKWIMPTSATLSWTNVILTRPSEAPIVIGNMGPGSDTITASTPTVPIAPGATITFVITGNVVGGDNRTATAAVAWGTDLTPDFADPNLSKTEVAIVSLLSLPRLTLGQVVTQLDNGRAKVVCTVSNDGQRADQLAFTVTPPTGMTWDVVAPTLSGSGGLVSVSRSGNVITASGTLKSFDQAPSGNKSNVLTWWWRPTTTDDFDDDTQVPETSADPATRPGSAQLVTLAYQSASTGLSYSAADSVSVDPATPDLDLSIPAAAFVTVGQTMIHTFTVTNSGEANSQARFATLSLETPGTGLTVLGVTPPGGSEIAAPASYPYVVSLATLAQGQTAVLQVRVQVLNANPYTLRASLAHPISEGSDAGNTVRGELQGRDAARARIAGFTLATTLAGTSNADSAGADLLLGEQLQAAITATWSGCDPARPVTAIAITSTLPTGAADLQVAGGTVSSGTTLTWNPTDITSPFVRSPAWRTTRDAANHVRGAQLNTVSNGSFNYLGVTWNSSTTGYPVSASRTVTATVREPNLTLTRAASPTGVSGTFTPNLIVTPGIAGTAPFIRVELRNADASAPVYLAASSEALPTGYELTGTPTLPAGWTSLLSGRTLTLTAGTLAPGAFGVAIYQLIPTAAVTVGSSATTRGTGAGTSLPDQPTFRKSYSQNKDVTLSAPRVDVLATDDTGISSTDDLTANARPRITFSPAPSDLASVVYTFRGPGPVTVTTPGAIISGGWQGRPGSTLAPDGAWTVTVTGTDAAGNAFASDALPFTLDTTAPTPTAVAAPSTVDGFYKAGVAIPLELTVSEPIPAGRTVTAQLSSGGTVLLVSDGTTTLRGTYSVMAGENSSDLNVASLVLSGGSTEPIDAAGNALDVSALPSSNLAATRAIVIDTVAPQVTRIESQPSTGFFKAGGEITISITTSEPILAGQTITVTLDTGAILTYTGDGSSLTLSAVYTVAPGQNSSDLTVISFVSSGTDRAGNPLSTSLPSGQNLGDTSSVVVDTTPPAAPAVVSIGDDTGVSASDQVTNDQTWTIGGTAEPFASVAVRLDGAAVGTATADTDGRWSLVVSATQAEGSHTISAVATDRAGNTGARSSTLAVTVDRTPPAILRIRSTSTDGFYTSAARLGLAIDVSEPIFGTVLVTLDTGDVITFIGTGSTTLTAEYVVSAGDTSLDLAVAAIATTATDRAGNVLGTAIPVGQSLADLAQLVIDTTAPTAPVISGIGDDTGISGSDGITNDNTLVVRGTGEVGTTVTVRLDGSVLGTALVAANGEWVLDRTATSIAGGAHTITATTIDLAGNVSLAAIPFPINVDRTAPAVVRLSSDTSDGSYTVGSNLTLRLTLSEAIPVGQSVSVTLDTGAVVVFVGDGSATELTAVYTVAVGQTSADLRATAISSSATDAAGNALTTTIPPGANLDATANLRIDTNIPARPVIAGISADTGTSTSDGVTNDQTVSVSGSAEANSTVRVLVDGIERATVIADGAGAWSVALSVSLADGTYAVTATATDAATNVSTTAAPYAMIIDTVAPLLQSVSAATPAGTYSVGSALTVLATFSEPLPAGATATLTLNNGRTVTVTGDGTALTLPATLVVGLGDDTPDLVVTGITGPATDIAGNALATTTFATPLDPGSLAIDTSAPDVPVISAISPDTGVTGDFVTSNLRPAVSGTAEPGTTVTLSADGAVIGTAVVAANGTWTITPVSDVAQGARALAVIARDGGGNDSVVATRTLVIDATPPQVTAFSAGVSGMIGSGGVVPLSATLDEAVAPGSTIIVQLDTGALVTLTNPGPAYSTVLNGTYTVGAGELSAALQVVGYGATNVLDAAGNRLTTATMPAANLSGVAVDGVPPVASAQPDLRTAQDSGSSATDNRTNVTAPTLDLPGVPADAVAVSVFLVSEAGGAPVTLTATFASGVWSVVLPSRTDGAWLIAARAQDAAGNTSPLSPGLRLVIDTTPPATFAAADLAATSDTGASSSDNLTSDSTPRIILVGVPVDAESAVVTLSSSAGPTQSLAAVRDSNGRWTVDIATALADGVWNVTARGTDAAGNVGSAAPALAVTVLTAAPLPPAAPDLSVNSDTGYSGTDDITNATSPTFTIPGVPVEAVVVKVRLRSPDGSLRILTAQNNAGIWSAVVPGNRPLEDGVWNVTAVAQDVVGNVSPEGPLLAVTIDTVAPRATAFTTAPASGVTFSLGDQIPVTLTYSEAVAPRSDAVIRLDTGASVFVSQLGVVYATTLTGTYAVGNGENSADLGVGAVTSQIVVDAAGNVASGETFTGIDNTTVVIDTQPVATLDGPDLAASSDTGRSDSDNVTATTAPTLVATSTNADSVSFTLTQGGTVVTVAATQDGAGTWTATVPSVQALADGVWQIEVTAVRLSVPTTVGPLAITIDTLPPADPGTPDLVAIADTGDSTTDNVTAQVRPSFTIPAVPSDATAVYLILEPADGSAPIRVPALNLGGNIWVARPTADVPDGTYAILASAQADDAAGNSSSPSAAITITIDTVPPVASQPPVLVSDSGTLGDATTQIVRPTMSVVVASDATQVTLSFSNGTEVYAVPATFVSGVWQAAPPQDLSEGSWTVTAVASDAAGNSSAASPAATIVIDTTADLLQAPVLATSSDTGVAGDTITKLPQPTITIPGVPADAVTVQVTFMPLSGGSPITGTATLNASVWQVVPNSALPDGDYSVTAVLTDAAGNSSAPSPAGALAVDATAPAAPAAPGLAAVSDSGTSSGDAITNVGRPLLVLPGVPADAVAATVTLTGPGGPFTLNALNIAGNWLVLTPTDLAAGVWSLVAIATDAAGNDSVPSAAGAFTIDRTGPRLLAINAVQLDGAYPAGTALTIQVTTDEPLAPGQALSLTLDTGTVLTLIGDGASTMLSGVYTVSEGQNSEDLNVIAVAGDGNDAAGNPFETSIPPGGNLAENRALIIDTTAPVLGANPLTVGPGGGVLIGTSSENLISLTVVVAGRTYSLSDPELTLVTGGWRLVLPAGTVTAPGSSVAVLGRDRAGNSGTATSIIDWDGVAPVAGLTLRLIGEVTPGTLSLIVGGAPVTSATIVNGTYRIELPVPSAPTVLTLRFNLVDGTSRFRQIAVGVQPNGIN